MPDKIIITISIDYDFFDKFIGLLKNLMSVNKDRKPFNIDSVIVKEIVAYPKDYDDSTIIK